MLAGVEILLERMKTNPEEFIEGGLSKWSRVMDAGWSVMTVEEQKALQDGMNEAKRDHFNGEVMRVLSGNVDEGESYATNLGKSMTLTSSTLKQQIKDTLDKQFDEAYARKDKKTMQTASKLKGMMRK
jgi:hypothetical protein